MVNQSNKEEIAKEDEFLLRNWSYYGLIEKIKYKAKMAGINVIYRIVTAYSKLKKKEKIQSRNVKTYCENATGLGEI